MTSARVRPVTPEALVELVADLVAERRPDHPVRVAVDGPAAAEPGRLADALVTPLRLRGRPAVRVRAEDFLRPASLRLERGRTDPDAWYELALDTGALLREVLVPLGPGGSGRYLPTFWDAGRDRATRAAYRAAAPGTVLLVDGALLLTPTLRWEFDLAVHLQLSRSARRRRTPAGQQWTLPAYDRYDAEVGPAEVADLVVRVDDPRRPAVLTAG